MSLHFFYFSSLFFYFIHIYFILSYFILFLFFIFFTIFFLKKKRYGLKKVEDKKKIVLKKNSKEKLCKAFNFLVSLVA